MVVLTRALLLLAPGLEEEEEEDEIRTEFKVLFEEVFLRLNDSLFEPIVILL